MPEKTPSHSPTEQMKTWSVEQKITTASKKAIEYAKRVDSGLSYIGNRFTEQKKFVNNTINATKQSINTKWNNLSSKTREVINTGKTNLKEAYNNGITAIENNIVSLWKLKDQLVASAEKGLIKGIQFSKETGNLIVDLWSKKVNVFLWSAKEMVSNIQEGLKQWTITGIQYAKNAGEVSISFAKKSIKVSLSVAIAAGIIVYKWWKFVINQSIAWVQQGYTSTINGIEYANNKIVSAKNKVTQKWREMKADLLVTKDKISKSVKNEIDTVVQDGREMAANVISTTAWELNTLASNISPKTSPNIASK